MYRIVSRLNGLALDVTGASTQPGTLVVTWDKHNNDNQLWYDDQATGTIRTKLNGFCLDIEGDQKLRIMPFHQGDPNQQWERDSHGYIRNRLNRNKVLDISHQNRSPGAEIIAWDQNNGENQLWNFEVVGGSVPFTAAASTQRRFFLIVSDFAGKALDVKGGKGNSGDDIVLYHKHQGKNQQWYTDQQGFIRSALNDLAINAEPNKKAEVDPFNGGPNQQWVFEGNRIVNRANGQVLDIYNNEKDDGTKILSWSWNNTPNQHWKLEYV